MIMQSKDNMVYKIKLHLVGPSNARKIRNDIGKICLASRRQAHRARRHQRSRRAVEWQIHREQHVAAVPVQIHRQVDEPFLALFRLHPPHLRRAQTNAVTVVENEALVSPRCSLQDQT